MKLRVLKNAAFDAVPSLIIREGDKEWEAAYNEWLSNRNPTKDPGWKLGVFFAFEEDEEPFPLVVMKVLDAEICAND